MKAQSDTKPDKFIKSRGKIQFNFNIIEKLVEDEYQTRNIFEYDYVEIENTERNTLINAVISNKYSKADEIAFINNKFRGKSEDIIEYNEYNNYRAEAKQIVDDLL